MLSKSDILDVIKKYLSNSVGDIGEIDPERKITDYGANSLDIVEIVSRTMRELKVKIPRSELSNITNIAGLVDIFYKCANEKENATSS